MHYLQKTILDKLRHGQAFTYTALMPAGIESSHFRYHLKRLMTDGLVEKVDKGRYKLSHNGMQEVDYLSENRTTIIRTPKIITYTLLTFHSKMLLYKKPKEPYRNLWGLIGGKVHFGEDIQVAAKREVYEKTGFIIEPPSLCGVADILICKDGSPLSHAIAYVHRAELEKAPATLPGKLELVAQSELGAYDLMPDLQPIIACINASHLPFVQRLCCQVS